MTVLIDDGWVWLTDGTDYLKLACKKITATPHLKPSFTHYIDGNFSVDMGMWWWTFKAQGVVIKTNSKYETIIGKLKDWQSNTLPYSLEIVRDSSGNKWKVDGTNTSYDVRLSKGNEFEKVAKADGTLMGLKMLIWEEG